MSRRGRWEALGPDSRATFERLVLRPGDVARQPPPVRPDLAVLVAARDDGIVPPASAQALHAHWPGSELRWVEGGHVSAWLLRRDAFAAAAIDAMRRQLTPGG
jgi:pimeloyl-ACP methyl ester carboxylesterase